MHGNKVRLFPVTFMMDVCNQLLTCLFQVCCVFLDSLSLQCAWYLGYQLISVCRDSFMSLIHMCCFLILRCVFLFFFFDSAHGILGTMTHLCVTWLMHMPLAYVLLVSGFFFVARAVPYTRTHTHTHAQAHTHTNTHTHTHTHAYKHTHTYTKTHTHTYTHTRAHMHAHMYTCVHAHMHTYTATLCSCPDVANGSCLFVNESHHIWMGHVSLWMNHITFEHTHEWVTSHTHMNESRHTHIWMSHVIHTGAAVDARRRKGVMSHEEWVTSH